MIDAIHPGGELVRRLGLLLTARPRFPSHPQAEGSGLTALVIAPAVAIDISRKSAADRAMQAGVAREEAVNAAVEAASHARESEVIAGCQEAVRRIGEQILADKLAEDIAKRKAEAKARLMKSAKTTLFNATMQKAADDAQAAREREQVSDGLWWPLRSPPKSTEVH